MEYSFIHAQLVKGFDAVLQNVSLYRHFKKHYSTIRDFKIHVLRKPQKLAIFLHFNCISVLGSPYWISLLCCVRTSNDEESKNVRSLFLKSI